MKKTVVLLEGNHNFSKTKQRYLRYRINKKLKLQGQGLTSIGIPIDVSSSHRDDAATPQQQPRRSRDGGSSLVRIPIDSSELSLESSNGYEVKDKRSGGPAEIRTPDPRHVKAVS
jgi:hypothetical protein